MRREHNRFIPRECRRKDLQCAKPGKYGMVCVSLMKMSLHSVAGENMHHAQSNSTRDPD